MASGREGELLAGRYMVEGPSEDGFAATDLTSGKRVHIAYVPRAAVAGARRAMELSGAHVVRILAAGDTAEGAAWIAREHVASDSLRRHLARRGTMSTFDAIEVALGVCDAVAEANGHGLFHGAIDASNVYLAWSASGLVDVQLAGIGTVCDPQPRDDVRSIAKLVETMLGGRVPSELRAVLGRGMPNALELAAALVPFAVDQDFAGDRLAARRHRVLVSNKVIASGAYPQSAYPQSAYPQSAYPTPMVAELPAPMAAPKRARKPSRPKIGKITRDMPTVVAPRPAMTFPRRRALRILGIATAALSVALLVLIGTEGARIAHSARRAEPVELVEATPPAQASIAPPVVEAPTAEPSIAPAPITRPADLPAAKPAKKNRK